MKLNELIKKRSDIIEQMDSIVKELEAKERSFNDEEKERYESLDKEQKELQNQINIRKQQDELNKSIVEREINNSKIDNKNMKIRNFKEIIQRNGNYIDNFKVRAIELNSNLYDEKVAGGLSVVGYEPLYKQMGVQVLSNLTSAIKLPYVAAMKASKKAQGARNNNDKAVATVNLTPARFPITETIGKELLSVGNEEALQAFIMEMVKGCDRGVTEEIYKVAAAGATTVTGATGYTTADFDMIVEAVDGDVTVLMPRADFYAAKSVKVDDGSGRFLVEKTSNTEGKLWDGTPLFYSNLFDGTAVVAADLQHITVGEFGDEYEVIFDYTSKAPEGQVVITVVKEANVVLRNANAVAKAVLSA